MILNYIQTPEYIVKITLQSFYSDYSGFRSVRSGKQIIEEFTMMSVTMTRFKKGDVFTEGDRLISQIEIFSEYRSNEKPDEVFEMYNEAWKAFMNACDFCGVSPVSDGTSIEFYTKVCVPA